MTVIRKVVVPLVPAPAGTTDRHRVRQRTSLLLAALLTLLLATAVGVAQLARPDAAPGSADRAQPGPGRVPAGADGDDRAAAVPAALAASLARSFVTGVDASARTVTVDMAADPAAVYAWLDETDAHLDGWTVDVTGIDVLDADERAAFDDAVGEPEGRRAVARRACPDVPTGPRREDGATVPYLGCDPATGHQPAARPVRGGPRQSLGSAVDAVVAELIPGADLSATQAVVDDGHAVVDLPSGFPAAVASASVPAYEIDRALIFTAYSNGALDSVRFRVAGDCLAYATAVDGDMCATVPLPVRLGAPQEGAR